MPDKAPANHRLAERTLIQFVERGEWEIDPDGRVWTTRRGPRRRAERPAREYLMVRAMVGGKRVCGQAHRLVWQHLHGDIPDGLVVNHINGRKHDNRPSNLEVVSYSENMRHAHRLRLRDERGEGNPACKLSNRDVASLRAEYATGQFTQAQLGARYGIAFQTVSKIIRGERRGTQGGPISTINHSHIACERDPVTGRFIGCMDGADQEIGGVGT